MLEICRQHGCKARTASDLKALRQHSRRKSSVLEISRLLNRAQRNREADRSAPRPRRQCDGAARRRQGDRARYYGAIATSSRPMHVKVFVLVSI